MLRAILGRPLWRPEKQKLLVANDSSDSFHFARNSIPLRATTRATTATKIEKKSLGHIQYTLVFSIQTQSMYTYVLRNGHSSPRGKIEK